MAWTLFFDDFNVYLYKTSDTMTAVAKRRYTLEEYAEFEYHAERRHYFYNGMILPMGYTSRPHGKIIANLMQLIKNAIEDLDYEVYSEARIIHVPACNLNYYPDIVFVKGEEQVQQLKPRMEATINPYALIEVLSETTADNDKFDKWKCYREIPSLQQYFMISQTECYIDIYNRIDNSHEWKNTYVNRMEQTILIAEFDISVAKIYKEVAFPKQSESATDEIVS